MQTLWFYTCSNRPKKVQTTFIILRLVYHTLLFFFHRNTCKKMRLITLLKKTNSQCVVQNVASINQLSKDKKRWIEMKIELPNSAFGANSLWWHIRSYEIVFTRLTDKSYRVVSFHDVNLSRLHMWWFSFPHKMRQWSCVIIRRFRQKPVNHTLTSAIDIRKCRKRDGVTRVHWTYSIF